MTTMAKLWNLIGVKRTVNGLGEVEYERKKDMWLGPANESMLEIMYWLGASIICGTLIWLNTSLGNGLGLICSVIGTVCAMLLVPVVIDIVEGYYSAWKPLW